VGGYALNMRIRPKLIAFAILLLIALALFTFDRANLGDPLPGIVMFIGGGGGALYAYLAFAETAALQPDQHGFRMILAGFGLAVAGIMAGVVLVQSLALRAAFVGVSSKPVITALEVEDRHRMRRKRLSSSRYQLTVRLPGAERDLRVMVDRALYEKVGPRPSPGEHCISLPVDQGRWGIRRVWAPNFFDTPISMASYRLCGGTVSF
jgi:hypothetical protein